MHELRSAEQELYSRLVCRCAAPVWRVELRRVLRRYRDVPGRYCERRLRHERRRLRKLHRERPDLQSARKLLRVHTVLQRAHMPERLLQCFRRLPRWKDGHGLRIVGASLQQLRNLRTTLFRRRLLLHRPALRPRQLQRLLYAERHVCAGDGPA
jgi:hypothetical protein